MSVESAVGVPQRGYGITNSWGNPPIGTPGVACCVVMIVYNPLCKEAVLAHLDSQTATMENVKKVFQAIADRPGALKVMFVGGWRDTKSVNLKYSMGEFISKLVIDLFLNYGYMSNIQYLFKNKFMQFYSYVGIDTKTGTVIVGTSGHPPFINPEVVAGKDFKSAPGKFPLKFVEDRRGAIDYSFLDPKIRQYHQNLDSKAKLLKAPSEKSQEKTPI